MRCIDGEKIVPFSTSYQDVSLARPIRASEMETRVSSKLSLRLYIHASPLLFQRVPSKLLALFLPPNDFQRRL
jgi:hypothetical protein